MTNKVILQKLFFILVLIFQNLVFVDGQCIEEYQNLTFQNIDYETVSKDQNRYEAFPTVVKCGNRLIAAYYSGTNHANNGEILVSISDDTGKKWSDPVFIEKEGNNWRTPNIIQLVNGNLALFYWNRIDRNETELPSLIRYRISEDCGNSWSDPTDLPSIWTASNRNEKPVVTNSGALLLPVAGYDVGQSLSNQKGGVYRTEDFVSWTYYPFTDQTGVLTEANIVIKENQIFAFNRINNLTQLKRAVSTDDGITWTEWEDVTPPEYENSRPDIILHENCLFIAYRSEEAKYLTLAISEDYGDTWFDLGTVDDLPSESNRNLIYADFVSINKSKLLLLFGWESSNSKSRILQIEIFNNPNVELSENSYTLYPNPFIDQINFFSKENIFFNSLKVFDTNGNFIQTINVNDYNPVINLSHLPSQHYYNLQITSDSGISTKTILKK